jgi:aminoglycoside 6'-N-acetyltransferase
MGRWLTDERVLEFYGGRDRPVTAEAARAEYVEHTPDGARTTACVIELDEEPIGYLQFYRWADWPEAASQIGLDDRDAFGIDLFIGEPDRWNRGIGTRVIEVVARYLFDDRGASALTLDPLTTNARAIRAYEKAGFRKQRIVRDTDLHEGERRDLWLMVRER